MVKWDDIAVGFDSAEETVNFGTRAVALTENGIYESETLATIHTFEKVDVNLIPHCSAIYNSKLGVAVASDKSFTVFDLKFTVAYNVSFESNIGCFQISDNGMFAFIGLQNLEFICLYLPLNERVFSKNLAEFVCQNGEEIRFINIIHKCNGDNFEVFAFLNNGLIVSFSGSDFEQQNNSGSDFKEKIEKYNSKLIFEIIRKPYINVSRLAISDFYSLEDKNLVFMFGDCFSTWEKEMGKSDLIKISGQHKIKKLDVPSSGNVIICLSEEGYFLLICLHTLHIIRIWNKEKIKDFTFIETIEHKTAFSNLLVITDSDKPDLCLIELPVFKVKLRLKVAHPSFLVYNQSSLEDILFIDGFGEHGIDTLRIKAVTESQPEFRLDRLLQRRKFSEAEKFARDLSLSLEEVYKAKVKWLMGELQLWNKTTKDLIKDYFKQLSSLLDQIKDVEFVAECCLKTVAPELKMIRYLLDYASKRLRLSNTQPANILNLLNEVNKASITLGTFIQISEDTTTPENWLIFCNSNPIMMCLKYLSKGEIDKTVIVCRRHEERIRNELPTGVAIDLFESTPLSVSVEGVLKWLKTYIPVVLKTHPDLLAVLVQWIIDRTKTLELQDPFFWPDKGLQFIKDIMNIIYTLPSSDPRLELPPLQENSRFAFSPIFRLTSLAKHIYELSILKSEYSISIDFDEYISTIEKENGAQEVVFLILDNVSQKTIPSLISGFLKKFCVEHFLELDHLLSQYIIGLARISTSWGEIESSWESRAIAFIDFIQNVNHKMSAIETTVANVTVPWSMEVSILAKNAIKVDHPLAEKIYLHTNNVPKKIIFRKYGLSDVHCFHIYGLINYIYQQGYENMIEDAKQLTMSAGPSIIHLPYVAYLLYCAEAGTIEKGLRQIKSELDVERCEKVIETTISYLTFLLQNRYLNEKIKGFDALLTLHSSLMVMDSPLAKELEGCIKDLKAFLTLKEKYNVNISFSSLYHIYSRREDYLKNYLKSISLSEDGSAAKEIVENACHVAFLLNLPKAQGLLTLGFISSEAQLIKLSAYCSELLLNCDSSFFEMFSDKILCLVSVLLQNAINLNNFDETVGSACHNLLKKVSVFCSSKNMKKVLNLITLVTLSYSPKPVMGSQLFKHIYSEQMEISAIQPSAAICQKVIQVDCDTSLKEDSDFPQEVENTLRDLPHNLSSIHRMQTIVWSVLPLEVLVDYKKIEILLEEKISNVLVRVVFSRNVDLELALSLFCLFQQECAFRWLETYTRNQVGNLKNASSVALVGKYYSMLTKKRFNSRTFAETYLKNEWFRKLQRFGIPPKVADSRCESLDGKRTLLLSLMNCHGIDLNFIHDFCRDLHFSFQECLKLYLEHTLLTWKPKYEEVINPKTGRSELRLLTKKDDLFLKCSQIEALIKNSDDLVDYLKKNVLQRVNFYYYEVHIVIVDIIIKLSPTHQELFRQHLQLLLFLMSYERISVLSSEETDNWFHFFPDASTVPPISKYRLPFTPLPPDHWKIIKPELSLKTYKLWFDAPMWFNVSLDKDVICSFTIMNLKGEIPNNSEWNLHFQYKSLMNDIEECISKIRNIETAVAASYCVVNYIMPPGADRVEAAQRCFIKAQEWYSIEKSENARVGLVKAEKKYLTVSTYHILYKYQLAKPEYLAVSLQPVNLITALYNDPSIIIRTTDFTAPKPDINKAVKRIADLYDIKLASVITELLTDWLQPNNSLNNSVDEFFAVPSTASYSDNIIRACYILIGYKEIRQLENHLVNIAFGQEPRTKSASTRLRALQCLRAINSNKDLELLTARDISFIRDYMLSLEFISDLEKFALDYSVATFDSCSKEQIVETLIKRSCPGAIALSAKICVTYKIWNPSIWESLLMSMTSFGMVNVLEFSLPELSHLSDLISDQVLISSWEYLIFSLLLKVRGGSEFQEEVDRCFDLLQSCPVMSHLNLDKIILLFKDLNRHELVEYLVKSKM